MASRREKEAQAKDPDEVGLSWQRPKMSWKARLCCGVKIVPGRKKV